MRELVAMLGYRFRLYPPKTCERKLNRQMALCRWLYNRLLSELNLAHEKGIRLKRTDTQALIVDIKHEKPELGEVYSKVLQMVNHQLWSNIRALAGLKRNGKRVGRLRFKGEGWFKTLNYNQSGFRLENGRLVLSKIGEIPIKLHRKIEGEVKGVIVKRERSGKWYAIFQAEDGPEPLQKTNKAVGIDVGIKHFLSDTEGRQVENPRFYERTLGRIRMRQRQVSKKQKDSTNREKARIKLARAHGKLVNQRNDFLHKLSHFYVQNYDIIVAEDLNIAGMVKNHSLSQRILDASWGKFLHALSYKAERAGRQFVKVDPRRTSQEFKHGELDRDYNAALNILERGPVGLGRPEPTPVEMGPLLRVPAQAVVAGQVPSLKQEATGF
ncbi:MAG: RNA-guided endonuclease TnpB family protein [Hadesarchaea archaeon]|nr:RNA-guided endonuclease TnpB family protein [Hadesarchaea archaeon]